MKVKLSIFSMFLSIVLTFSTYSDELEFLKRTQIEETQIKETATNTSGGGGSSSNRKKTVNPLYPVEVGEWGLYLPGQRLSFYAPQWVRDSTKEYTDNDSVNVYLYKAYAEPSGIIDVEIKENYLNIFARKLGTTTVTAWVYSDEGHIMSNSVKITTKEVLPDFINSVDPIELKLNESETYSIDLLIRPIVIETRDVIIQNVASNNENVIAESSDYKFSLYGNKEGESVVTVELLDISRNVLADTSFNVTVTDHVYGN